MSTIPRSVRLTVYERANHACERCGRHADGGSIHHRNARRMGGSRGKDVASNLVLLCGSGVTGCHGEIESKALEHYEAGWLVPAQLDWRIFSIPHVHLGHVWLSDDGMYLYAPPEGTPA